MDAENQDALPPAATATSLSVAEAADRLGLSRWTINGWISSGALPAIVVAGRRRLRAEDVDIAEAAVHAGGVVPAWRREPFRAGWRLRQLREAAELTQIELAARCGLTHEAISRLELGRATPLATSVRRLAKALGVAPADFVREVGTERGLTTAAAAARLGVTTGRIQAWLLSGHLTGWKASGQWRVAPASVAALEASGRMRGRSRRLDPRFRG